MASRLLANESLLCEKATTFTQLSEVALMVVGRMTAPVGQVCGPISTGGKGSIEANLEVFAKAIEWLAEREYRIFNQMPFEKDIFRIIDGGYSSRINDQLLREFYGPIFASGLVQQFFFIPGWETSQGAYWEYGEARRCGYEILYLQDMGFPA